MMNIDMKKTVAESAYAKINLWLEILGRREDGYHNIRSIMQTVSLCDTVTVRLTEREVGMTCSDSTLSCGRDNLCVRAAEIFIQECGGGFGVSLHLEKNIPREAGLGGGSADAAAVLRALNTLCGEFFDTDFLRKMGKKLGADVPFCISGGTALAEGVGEILSEYYSIPDCFIVVSSGFGHISTPEAYRRIDSVPDVCGRDFGSFQEAMKTGDLAVIGKNLYNRFEDAVPEALEIKAILLSSGAAGTLMSGSGSAVFGLFDSLEKVDMACALLEKAGLSSYICHPIKQYH